MKRPGTGTEISQAGPKIIPTTDDQRRDATAYLMRTGNADLLAVLGLDALAQREAPRCRFCSDDTAGPGAKTCGSTECRRLLMDEKRADGRAFQRSTMGSTAYGVGR